MTASAGTPLDSYFMIRLALDLFWWAYALLRSL
jgi:hypothetical protein